MGHSFSNSLLAQSSRRFYSSRRRAPNNQTSLKITLTSLTFGVVLPNGLIPPLVLGDNPGSIKKI